MLSGSSNSSALWPNLPDEVESRMALTKPEILDEVRAIYINYKNILVSFLQTEIYTYLKFRGRHRGFSISGFFKLGRITLPLLQLDSEPRKHRYSRWNFLAMLFTNWYTYLKFRGRYLELFSFDFFPFSRKTFPLFLLDNWIPNT